MKITSLSELTEVRNEQFQKIKLRLYENAPVIGQAENEMPDDQSAGLDQDISEQGGSS